MIKVISDSYELFEPIAQTAFSYLKLKGKAEISVEIIDDEQMRILNNDRRGIDKTTDVLSFPALNEIKEFTQKNYPTDCNPETGAIQIGDIAINLDAAKRQSEEYGTGEREIKYLFLHGLLHVLGFDHEKEEDKVKMRKAEEDILAAKDKVAFVAVVGRPNAGKSSLVNRIVGERVSIISPKPQTTRDNVTGVLTEGNVQLIFTDTPGSFSPRTKLDEYMVKCIRSSYSDVDAVVIVLDAKKGLTDRDKKFIEERLEYNNVYIAVNKVDLASYEGVYPILSELNKYMTGKKRVKDIVPISCKTGENVELLKEILKGEAKEGSFVFDRDEYTDRSARFIASEIVREKALLFLQEEIPHGIAVSIVDYDESKTQSDKIEISADIIVEKKSHKPIVIGEGGEKIKRIGTSARKELEGVLGDKVNLKLFVKVRPDWRDNPAMLTELSYRKTKR